MWKYTAILTLLIIGVMQVLPFVPTHKSCEAACCQEAATYCETESSSSCEMSMTSCEVSIFIPLISAPLIKIESHVQFEIAATPAQANIVPDRQNRLDVPGSALIQEAPPPGYFPLLI